MQLLHPDAGLVVGVGWGRMGCQKFLSTPPRGANKALHQRKRTAMLFAWGLWYAGMVCFITMWKFTPFLSRVNFYRKLTLFCREANFVENLRTFEGKIPGLKCGFGKK